MANSAATATTSEPAATPALAPLLLAVGEESPASLVWVSVSEAESVLVASADEVSSAVGVDSVAWLVVVGVDMEVLSAEVL